jgi:Chitobiase/beta-hexosaminidase C-terminal domain
VRNREARPRAAAYAWATAAAVAGTVALTADARASLPTPQSVRAGHNITVFHNIDMVGAFGHGTGEHVRVDVVRGGHRIATAAGTAVQLGAPEGGALEVNHGPLGVPLPGDCWESATPDIRPGDLVRATSAGAVDEAVVDDITIDTVSRQPGPNATPGDDDDEIWVEGAARSGITGEPIPLAQLDSGEFRDPLNNKLRIEANEVVEGAAPGTYRAIYRAPFRFVKGPVATSAALAALERDGHAFGFGHVPLADGSLRPDAMLVEGMLDTAGPAPGCEASPHAPSSVGTTSVDAIGAAHLAALADGDVALTVGGWAAAGVGDAAVELRDAGGTTVVRPATGLDGAATAPQGWSAPFTKADVAGLAQGALTARLIVAGAPAGAARTVVHDVLAPAPPTASPAPGRHEGTQLVRLIAESGATIRYTTDGSVPTATSPRFLGAFLLSRTTTIRAIAVDAAGNVSPVATLPFTIVAPGAAGGVVQPPAPAAVTPAAAAQVPLGAIVRPPSAITLRVARLSAPARLSAGRARRKGVTASFVVPAGARYADARLYRLVGGRRTLVAQSARLTSGGRVVARFTSASVRRKLRPGRYAIQVRTGPEPSRLGPAVGRSLRITR